MFGSLIFNSVILTWPQSSSPFGHFVWTCANKPVWCCFCPYEYYNDSKNFSKGEGGTCPDGEKKTPILHNNRNDEMRPFVSNPGDILSDSMNANYKQNLIRYPYLWKGPAKTSGRSPQIFVARRWVTRNRRRVQEFFRPSAGLTDRDHCIVEIIKKACLSTMLY